MPQHLRRHDELGHIHFLTISCYRRLPFFGTPDARDLVVQCMKLSLERLQFRWIGYVIMPEHVHWLCYAQTDEERPIPISSILHSAKTAIGMKIKDYWREVWSARRTLGNPLLDHWATAEAKSKPIWTTRGIDFNVTTQEKTLQKLEYCHNNPVKRGLANNPGDWPWSSFNYYEGTGRVLLDMN